MNMARKMFQDQRGWQEQESRRREEWQKGEALRADNRHKQHLWIMGSVAIIAAVIGVIGVVVGVAIQQYSQNV